MPHPGASPPLLVTVCHQTDTCRLRDTLQPMVYEVIVLGGGVMGLSAAWQVLRRFGGPVAVVDQYSLLHDRGSSHGYGRITRCVYADRAQVAAMAEVQRTAWPLLEADLGRSLRVPCAGCFWGPPGGLYEQYADAVVAAGSQVERIDPAEARRRFPAFRFDGAAGVLHDRSSAVVRASDTVSGLANWCRRHGATLMEGWCIEGIGRGDPIKLYAPAGVLKCKRLVVTAGAWSSELLPGLDALRVARQDIGYWSVDGRSTPDAFPVWVYLGDDPSSVRYGLPAYGRPGIKAARHWVAGKDDDPDRLREPSEAALDEVEAFLGRELALPLGPRLGAETCLYTNTADEDFVIDAHPQDPRIVVAAGFSGHGFKWAPLVGSLLADLVTTGDYVVPSAPALRERWRYPT